MSETSILAIDLAKNSFQVCGVRSDGLAVFKCQRRGLRSPPYATCLFSARLNGRCGAAPSIWASARWIQKIVKPPSVL